MCDANQDEQAWLADRAHDPLADRDAGLAHPLHHCPHASTSLQVPITLGLSPVNWIP
jgi:hypothetical protein